MPTSCYTLKTLFILVTSKRVHGGIASYPGLEWSLVTDVHLASLAIEHGCMLASTDSRFARFSKLKWKNPLT